VTAAGPGRARAWSAVTRAALGFAALGAGLLHLALAVGAAPWLAVLLIAGGAAEFLWGVLATSRPAPPVPRAALVGALVPPAAWVVLLLAGLPDQPRPLPMLAATVLDLAVAIGVATALRRGAHPQPRHPAVGIAVAGVIVAALTVPALIATEAVEGLPGELTPVHEEPSH
jgi:hypothetical protein